MGGGEVGGGRWGCIGTDGGGGWTSSELIPGSEDEWVLGLAQVGDARAPIHFTR